MASKYRLESTGIDPGAHGQHQRVLDRIGLDMADTETRAAAYTPGSSGDWAGDPTTIGEALNRIAAAIRTGTTGVPIA